MGAADEVITATVAVAAATLAIVVAVAEALEGGALFCPVASFPCCPWRATVTPG